MNNTSFEDSKGIPKVQAWRQRSLKIYGTPLALGT